MPSILNGPKSKGGLETARAITVHKRTPRPRVEFEVYRDPSIKAALNESTGYKCAYCESRYGAVHPVDSEHYRPKSAFRDRDGSLHPGYYWLAADWNNLLPSCIDCNRRRRHEDSSLSGKASAFPIRGPRAQRPGEENRERPLLLHPFRDKPEKHLEFTLDGGVVPKLDSSGRLSGKGRMSILLYGLSRPILVRFRAQHALRVQRDIEMTYKAAEHLGQNPDNANCAAILRSLLQCLADHIHPKSQYAALSRQLVLPALNELGIDIRPLSIATSKMETR